MEALPIRPQTPHRSPHRTTGAVRRPSAATAHKAATPHEAAAPHKGTAAHPAVPVDPAVLAQQREFDQIMILQAEQEREANALRDLAMQQIKRDDQTMNEWIKLI
jgi:hypothetical protein